MVDTVTSQTIVDGDRIAVMKFTNTSDGTGESAVDKVTPSSLLARSRDGAACTSVSLMGVKAMAVGMSVNMLWDASTDVIIMSVPQDNYVDIDYSEWGSIPNNAGAGKTNKIQFTTVGHTAGDTYSIVLKLRKNY